ncbi:MAG TPA: hypothetical protein PKZ41_05990, partial [Candidatus Omnitrophota bacterium]|nr:hypothetical protein [Candidatus Omnitrophota bacterium]
WPKDRSFLIPQETGYIAYEDFDRYRYPVGGEMVAVPGIKPVLLVSESAPGISELDDLSGKYPALAVRKVPEGFVTVRLSGDDALIPTTHIDCVINAIPPAATSHSRPVILVDPRYYREMEMRTETRELMEDLQLSSGAVIVVVPEEEAYLNPANFALLGGSSILMNKAPLTRAALIEAGVEEGSIFMLDTPVTGLAFLGGSIGCAAGLFSGKFIFPSLADSGMGWWISDSAGKFLGLVSLIPGYIDRVLENILTRVLPASAPFLGHVIEKLERSGGMYLEGALTSLSGVYRNRAENEENRNKARELADTITRQAWNDILSRKEKDRLPMEPYLPIWSFYTVKIREGKVKTGIGSYYPAGKLGWDDISDTAGWIDSVRIKGFELDAITKGYSPDEGEPNEKFSRAAVTVKENTFSPEQVPGLEESFYRLWSGE